MHWSFWSFIGISGEYISDRPFDSFADADYIFLILNILFVSCCWLPIEKKLQDSLFLKKLLVWLKEFLLTAKTKIHIFSIEHLNAKFALRTSKILIIYKIGPWAEKSWSQQNILLKIYWFEWMFCIRIIHVFTCE